MNESTTITIDNIAKLIKGIAEAEYQRGYVAGLEEQRLTEKHWGKEKEDKTELNNIIKNAHGSIENRINAAYNLGRRECYEAGINEVEAYHLGYYQGYGDGQNDRPRKS